MQINLRRIGALGLTFSCLLSAQAADEASMMCAAGMLGCGVAFETPIEPTPSPLTTTTTGQTTYTIINNDDVNDVNIVLSLTEVDNIGDALAVQFDGSGTCPLSGTLAAGDTCTIVLDFAPNFPGELDWTLTVTPSGEYTAQLPLVLTLETDVTGTYVPYAVTGGYYEDSDENYYPLLTLSTDGGNDWSYVLDDTTTPLPYQYDITNPNQKGIWANSCFGSYCVAGGYYIDTDENSYPFVASTAGGVSWSYTFDSSNPALPSDYNADFNGNFYDASCSGSTCMLGGEYTSTDSNQYPLAIISNDGGVTWDLTISSSLNAPSDINLSEADAEITGASCTDSTSCLVAGTYLNTSGGNYPLLAYSTYSDDTWNWTYPDISSQIPSDINDYPGLRMSDLSCIDDTCIVGGTYGSPIVYMSFDGGESWSLMIDSSSPSTVVPSDWDFSYGGNVNGVSCSDTACAAAGNYSDSSFNIYPYLVTAVISDDYPCTNASNCNWAIAIDSANLYGLDSKEGGLAGGGSFDGVSCSETTCVASGYYYSSTDGHRYPLVATFTLSDSSVAYSIDYTTINANPPTDFGFANLYQTSCTGSFCTAGGSYASESVGGVFYPFLITSQDAGNTWAYTIDGTTETLPVNFVSGQFNPDDIAPPTVKK